MSITQRKLTHKPYPLQLNLTQSLNHSITFPENSRWTKQSFKEECDINTIMGRYIQTGILPDMAQVAPQYLDCSEVDFQAAMDFVAGANTLFHELPSSVRAEFGNDTKAFLEFTSNPNNRSAMAQMGLLRDDLSVANGVPAAPPIAPLQEAPSASPQKSSSNP